MIRYLLWQLRHMHTLHFDIIDHQPVCPRCGEVYKRKEKTMSTQNTPATSETTPQRSAYAVWAFNLIFFALGTFMVGVVALFLGLPISTVICLGLSGFALLTSISLAVLSLRESV